MSVRQPTYAGRPERLLANLLDTIILLIPSAFVVGILKGSDISVVGVFACNLAYYTYFTAGAWQATPGKRLLGIYVARTDHRALTSRDALERYLAFVMPVLPLYVSFLPQNILFSIVFWLSLFWFTPILFTPERIGYHDRLCKTRVLAGKVGV